MSNPTPHCERLLELLADRAAVGLTDAERAELSAIERELGVTASDGFDLTAAALATTDKQNTEPLPEALRARLHGAAEAFIESSNRRDVAGRITPQPSSTVGASTSSSTPTRPPALRLASAGWLAAAACLAIAALAWFNRGAPSRLEPVTDRAQIIAAGGTHWAWSAWSDTAIPEAANVTGEAVWSPRNQSGVMVFNNLPATDPSQSVYQLWIIDADRPSEPPVDGGVFTIAAGQTTATVPFSAKIKVGKAAAFAVTVEKPGGVTVSKQEKRVVIAAPKG